MRFSRRRRLVGLLAATSVLVVPAAAHAEGWYPSETFNTSSATLETELVPRTDGNAIGAWLNSTSEDDPATLVAQLDIRGTFPSPPVVLDTIVKADNTVRPRFTTFAAATGASSTAAVAWAAPVAGNSSRIKLARLNADGGAGPAQDLGTALAVPEVAVNLDDRGVALVVYSDGGTVRAVRVTPQGATLDIPLGPGDNRSQPLVRAAPDGTAWIAWERSNQSEVQVVRLDPAGAVASGLTQLTQDADLLQMAVAPDGSKAVLGGIAGGPEHTEVAGARLAATGPVVSQQFSGARIGDGNGQPVVPSIAIGNDGTVTLARSFLIPFSSEMRSVVGRVLPGNVSGTVIPEALGSPGALQAGALPALATAPDGRVLVAWASLGGTGPSRLASRMIAADGALGPIADGGASTIPLDLDGSVLASGLKPVFLDDGTVKLGLQELASPTEPESSTRAGLRFLTLDATAPALTVTMPAEAQVGTTVTFAQDASDPRGLGTQTWDFGDGSAATGASVTHTYGAPGTYTVKATAADGAGNVAEVTRELRITAVPAPPAPPQPPAVVQLVQPPVVAKPVRLPAAAQIKVSKAVRTRRKVAVSGTIARSAGGRVTIAYTVRISGALVTQRKTAKIKAGRWSTTLTLPSSVLKARRAATVSITYAGDSDTRKGTARATVVVAKPKRG